MAGEPAALAARILHFEEMLANSGSVLDRAELFSLIDDDFMEIGRSGTVYRKQDIMEHFSKQTGKARVLVLDFEFRLLGENLGQALYRTLRESVEPREALRSSIWKSGEDGRWTLLFHQATPL